MKKICLFILLVWQLTTPTQAQNPGDVLFGQNGVHTINIDFYLGNYWDSLTYYKEQSDISGINHYLPALVTFDGVVIDSVGVRLRGNSSYSHPGTKKPIKLDFNEFKDEQTFDGLKSISLNNSSYDPTMIREKLFLDMLKRHGVTAPRCSFARVNYNGNYVGLYKIIETIDKTFLATHYNYNDGNLFKCEPNTPLTWEGPAQSNYYDNFELNTNETQNNWASLVDFIYDIDHMGPDFVQRMQNGFDTEVYLKAWAANNLFCNLDTYMYLPHNFYLYDDSLSGEYKWITWDVGLVMGVMPQWFQNSENLDILYLPNPSTNLPLNNNLLQLENYKTRYLNELCNFLTEELASDKLNYEIDDLANLIRPHVYDEPVPNQMYTPAQFEGNLGYEKIPSFILFSIPGLKDFLNKRRNRVYAQLCNLKWSCVIGDSYANLGEDVINIYPNPANNELNIQFLVPNNTTLVEYQIFDITGRKMDDYNGELPKGSYTETVSTQQYAPGVYIIKPKSECSAVEKKFIVVK